MTARKPVALGVALLLVAGAGAAGYKYRAKAASIVSAEEPPIPTARVTRGALEMSVHSTGSLRAVRSMVIPAPPVGGGILRLISMVDTGAVVKKDDVIMQYDPTEQEYNLEQAQLDLDNADQSIIKMNADTAVQQAQQEVDLMTARFDVRRAELDAAPDRDLVPPNVYQTNQINLDEARRKLAQLQESQKAQAETNRAALGVATEKRTKAKLAADRAKMAIDSLVVKAPMDGVFVARENRDAAGNFFYYGMTAPSYQAGDNVYPGRQVGDVYDISHMEVTCRVNELERLNVAPGQSASIESDSLPNVPYTATVKSISGTAQQSSGPLRMFPVTLQMDQNDPRLRPGTTVHLLLAGTRIENVLHLPRQAIFEKAGKPIVYARTGDHFEAREVKPTHRGESRIALDESGGIVEGLEVALVNPETLRQKGAASTSSSPAAGGSK